MAVLASGAQMGLALMAMRIACWQSDGRGRVWPAIRFLFSGGGAAGSRPAARDTAWWPPVDVNLGFERGLAGWRPTQIARVGDQHVNAPWNGSRWRPWGGEQFRHILLSLQHGNERRWLLTALQGASLIMARRSLAEWMESSFPSTTPADCQCIVRPGNGRQQLAGKSRPLPGSGSRGSLDGRAPPGAGGGQRHEPLLRVNVRRAAEAGTRWSLGRHLGPGPVRAQRR